MRHFDFCPLNLRWCLHPTLSFFLPLKLTLRIFPLFQNYPFRVFFLHSNTILLSDSAPPPPPRILSSSFLLPAIISSLPSFFIPNMLSSTSVPLALRSMDDGWMNHSLATSMFCAIPKDIPYLPAFDLLFCFLSLLPFVFPFLFVLILPVCGYHRNLRTGGREMQCVSSAVEATSTCSGSADPEHGEALRASASHHPL